MVLASSDPWSGGITPARIWGTALPAEAITLGGLPDGAIVTPSNPWLADASGNWSIQVSATASLNPANLTFTGSHGTQVILGDVLFGHTFLCSGQSNMDFPVICSFSGDATYTASLAFPEIRLMNAGLSDGSPGFWYSAANTTSNSSVEDFSATCYYTALALKRNVPALAGIPLGLVRASVGGQVIERFMAEGVLLAEGLPAPNASNMSCDQSSHTLFDSLIAPLAPFLFKSMIFYHGEGNVGCNIQPSPDWEVRWAAVVGLDGEDG
jgi:sialate O-acetylesterase